MTYVETALSRLTSQFQNSEKLRAMVSAIIAPLDEIDSTITSLKTERWIDTAIGTQLDGCGAIVGESRFGRDDDLYRQAIRFRVFTNISNGTPNDLIKALTYLAGGWDKQYLEVYPATCILFTDSPDAPLNIQPQMQALAPAGVSDIQVMVSFVDKPFRFGGVSPTKTLHVNGKVLRVNGKRLKIFSSSLIEDDATLGGIAFPSLRVNNSRLRVNGKKLRLATDKQAIFDSGFVLTGVFND